MLNPTKCKEILEAKKQRNQVRVNQNWRRLERAFLEVNHQSFNLKMVSNRAGLRQTIFDKPPYQKLKKRIRSHPNYQKFP